MRFDLLTIFPEIFDSYITKGMIRVAREKKKIDFKIHFLRDHAVDRHGTVDDRPFGGGPGQVFRIEPIVKTLNKIRRKKKSKIILLSAKGKKWNQEMAREYAKLDQLIFICPRYEGVDERVKNFIDEEISIGDYILTGGELGALVIIDSVTRLIPGVLGKEESLDEESHSTPGYLEYPHYTRPEVFKYKKKTYGVPEILLSGHHAKIKEWRDKQTKGKE
jgi:tRNA (guanine37-N1)-methyltransferase